MTVSLRQSSYRYVSGPHFNVGTEFKYNTDPGISQPDSNSLPVNSYVNAQGSLGVSGSVGTYASVRYKNTHPLSIGTYAESITSSSYGDASFNPYFGLYLVPNVSNPPYASFSIGTSLKSDAPTGKKVRALAFGSTVSESTGYISNQDISMYASILINDYNTLTGVASISYVGFFNGTGVIVSGTYIGLIYTPGTIITSFKIYATTVSLQSSYVGSIDYFGVSADDAGLPNQCTGGLPISCGMLIEGAL
jgi:hypothetical protein